jgi:hypothetical protein
MWLVVSSHAGEKFDLKNKLLFGHEETKRFDIKGTKWILGSAFLVDIIKHLNEFNLNLGKNKLIT